MIAAEILQMYNEEKPNKIDDNKKLNYIKQLERYIYNEIVLTHDKDERIENLIQKVIDEINEYELLDIEDGEPYVPSNDMNKYWDAFSVDTELFAEEPYEEVYKAYIELKIAQNLAESVRYNQALTLYNNAWNTYLGWYRRNHMPKTKYIKVINHGRL